MKRTFNLLLLLYLFFIGGRVTGQEFENIVPLSPNAAAIAKYGEVPINHFSGVPNIGLPIYTIASGSLELPLALSYHAGGNKVETISSWVGLGWSLTSIPSISRSVRGIPDDGSGGYFKKIAGKTVKEYWYSQYDESKVTFDTFRQRLRLGEADSEPDIFQYNIPGESGKFIYNQENEQFVTIPKSNTRISWDGYNFTIVDENGVQYFFNVKEKNTGQSSNNNSSSVVTSWCATRILAANQVDEIVLEYYPYAEERYKTITSVTKYQYIEGPTNGVSFKDPAGSVVTNNIVEVKPIKRIDFAGGYVLFNISEAERDDLNGGHSLDNIEVYTSLDQIVKRYKFEYGYLTGSGDIYEDKANKWMILNSFENQYLDQPSGLTHHFYYNTSNIPSSRNSAAQDNWGYYNGAEQNSNLIPSISIKTEDQRIIQVEGANRQINATKSQFGILKKITYPTGGYTEFDFENNEVIAGVVEPEYENDYVSCSADDFLNFEETLKIKNSFESEVFTIDFPPDMKINGNHEEGGAFISFEIDHLGCELNGHSGPCADLRIVNVATNQSYFINMNTTFHVLNGEYKLTASFEQDPPNYQNYVFIANWFKFKEQSKYYAGGLRVKEIRTYPTGDSNENPLIKRYKYVSDFESEESSGDVFSKPNFVYSDFVTYVAQYDDGNVSEYGRSAIYLRMKSYPNTQQISHSGSFVGYKNVIEETSSLEEQGCTVYKYSHARDLVSQEFPYPPAKSKELQRGKLLEKIDFKFEDGCYVPVRKKIFKYMYGFYEPEGEMEPLYSLGVKWGNIHFGSSSETNYAQYLKRYDLNFDFSKLSKEINIDYIGSDSIFQTTDYDYDIRYLHLKSSDFSDSQGKNTKTHYKYPLDYNPIENFSTLIDNNIIGRPIDIRTYKDNVLISGEQKKYNNLGELTDLYKFESSAQDISFKENDAYTYSHKLSASYYSFGKIKSVHPDNNIVSYYVWAYDHKYPVVEIKSSNESLNVEQIQVAVDAINLSRSQNQSLILSDINNLKVAVQAYLSDADFANYYTYSPLLGMTSKIDVNGVCTFYEFDTFGRLRVVKDDDNKIINEYLYHYVGDKPYTGGLRSYTVSVTQPDNGSISPGNLVLEPNETKQVQIFPDANYQVKNVIVNDVSQGAISSLTLFGDKDYTISAEMKLVSYQITSTSGYGGTISTGGAVNHGSNKTFTITPSTGYHITNVKVDGVSQGAISSYVFSNVTASHTIHVDFAINTYSISSTKSSGGSITGSATLNYGSNKTFTITPSTGYHITNVKVDGVSQGAISSYTFSNVTASHTIHADFAINTYSISSTKSSGGSITGSATLNYGSNKTFTITPSTLSYYQCESRWSITRGYKFLCILKCHSITYNTCRLCHKYLFYKFNKEQWR
ncbi:InlB B-repeat-containing protein [Marinifilum fragile]|uniref:InlB B-repeat-containing protein n=1 Tax=Marinifilum fragile TaxID=570161 RepID=UPI002AA6E1CC|nr:hypothetical protein [Marinifilum fragile]